MALNFEVGGRYTITEKINPYTNKKDTQEIVVLSQDRHNGYYFYNVQTQKVFHTNIFVWGIDSFKFLTMEGLEIKKCHGKAWLHTGIESVDCEMGNLGIQYQLFCELAPKKLFKKYERQENNNYHHDNGKMVLNFLNFVSEGGDPNLFI